MPELPEIEAYLACLRPRVVDKPILAGELKDLFILRTVTPRLEDLAGHHVRAVSRLGKRLVLHLENDFVIVLHLMIAGRLRWRDAGKDEKWLPNGLLRLQFPEGRLTLTEAGSKRRAKVHVIPASQLEEHDPGGVEVLTASFEEFWQRLRLRNHTVKRALTDPTLFSGIGNAYSDEILWEARLGPLLQTQKLTEEQGRALYLACRESLPRWTEQLIEEAGGGFPETVTAFHPSHAMHGKYLQPCPRCATPVQRIRYADNETNYCPECQTGGRLMADRALSRLLKSDYPRTWQDQSSL